MKNAAKFFFVCITLITLLFAGFRFFNYSYVFAETEQERLEKLSKEIGQYEQEIQKLKSQASTLSNQIAQYDAQIRLTSLKIEQTQERISLLGGRINQLETSLGALSKAFTSRVIATYKIKRLHKPLLMLVSSPDLGSVFSSFYYLRKIQEADRDLLVRLEKAQVSYEEEKVVQENLEAQLEEQRNVLGTQKVAKAILLEQTRSDEKKFQQLLAVARSEFEAIQAIIAGKGQETQAGKVSQGQRIATVIQGPSCNSSGPHLHFIVSQNGNTQNPFNYLRGGVDFENCSGSSCGSGDGDSFNPSGSWDWPLNPRIKFSQGYGSTWAVRNTWVGNIYQFHNGIDIDSLSNSEVKAVTSGTLFQGSYTGSGGCKLRYVRVDHDDSELDTFYLHINY